MKKNIVLLLALAFLLLGLQQGRADNLSVPCLQLHGAGTGCSPVTTNNPLPVGADSGATYATATPANSSHAAGTSIGGLMAISVARVTGGSGIITNLNYISTGGSTGQLVVRLWQKNPANTTCTDNTAFASSITDDQNLITAPFSITPAAPASTTGDAKTYASMSNLVYDYANQSTNKIIYACLVTVSTDTADENSAIYVGLSGPQN